MGTRKRILVLRIIFQKRIMKETFIAFDNVNRIIMFNIIKIVEIKHADSRILYNLYKDKIVIMEIQYNVEEIKINKGVW